LDGKPIVDVAAELGFADVVDCKCTCPKDESGGAINNNEDSPEGDDRLTVSTLSTSEKGIEFIKGWEDFESKPYNDGDKDAATCEKRGFCTIGYGHLIARTCCEDITIPDEFKNGIDKAKALAILKKDLKRFEKAVRRDITVNLYQHEFDALVSLLFNNGANFLNVGGANKGDTKIKKNINNKKYEDGAEEFRDVTKSNGKVMNGLVKRRKAEINMFKNDVYDSTH